jgi:hypothetical protein
MQADCVFTASSKVALLFMYVAIAKYMSSTQHTARSCPAMILATTQAHFHPT